MLFSPSEPASLDFTFTKPRKELISSSAPSASATAELLEILWSQPKVFVVPSSPFPVKRAMCSGQDLHLHAFRALPPQGSESANFSTRATISQDNCLNLLIITRARSIFNFFL